MKNNRPSVLIVEDDANLVLILSKFINSMGFNVCTAYNGEDGLNAALSNKHQLFIIDLGLSDIHGFKLIERIRGISSKPIIVITGNLLETNEIESFKLKANIFHRKPINFELLEVQIRALISPKKKGNIITTKNLSLDINRRICRLDNKAISLTKTEFNFLLMLLNSNGEVFTRKQIIYSVMNYFSTSSESCVDTMVSRIRKKLKEKDVKNSLITTVNCTGYKLNPEYLRNIQREFS